MLTTELLSIVLCVLLASSAEGSKKVKLEDVQVLTLRAGQLTMARRSNPIAQLECVGGTAGCPLDGLPKVVQCTNVGYDGRNVNWRCEAELDMAYRFGNLDVSCEGFDYPDDDYVLAGSCGLRYSLDLVSGAKSGWSGSSVKDESSMIGQLATIGALCFIAYILWSTCLGPMLRGEWDNEHPAAPHAGQPSAPPPPPGFNFGEAPPPYSDNDADRRRRPPQANLYPDLNDNPHTSASAGPSRSYWSGNRGGPSAKYTTSSTSSGPGFWTGLAAGSLGGYLFGRASTPSSTHQTHHQPSNSWGSSTPTYTTSSSRSNSSGTRSATGYATTSRR